MQLSAKNVCRAAFVTVAGLGLAFCGGASSGSKSPITEAPTTPVGGTPTTVPLTAVPLSASCERLPLGSETYRCRDESPTFASEVQDAITDVKREHPEYFERGDVVNNVGGYYVGVIRNLDKQGICAGFDGEELTVKNTSEFNDQYKILTSWGQVRNFYIGTCYPAVFPLSRSNFAPSPAGCNLAPSVEIACGNPDSQFLGEVLSAIDQVQTQKPELFDFSQSSNGWPMVRDMPKYHAAVIDVLASRGYCGKFDGEEIAIKRSNDFTEHYDINYADRYVRKGPGIYRGACYPAAF